MYNVNLTTFNTTSPNRGYIKLEFNSLMDILTWFASPNDDSLIINKTFYGKTGNYVANKASFSDCIYENWKAYCDNECINTVSPTTGSGNTQPNITITGLNTTDTSVLNSYFVNKRFRLKLKPNMYTWHYINYDVTFDRISGVTTLLSLYGNNSSYECINTIDDSRQDYVNIQAQWDDVKANANIWWDNLKYVDKIYGEDVTPSECDDERTSESTQGCYLTANWVDVLGNQFSEDYTLLFQPDSQHTSGSISMSSSNFKGMMSLAGVTCRFNRGVVRDSGYIKINGHIKANKYTVDMLGNTMVPVFSDVTENFLIQFSFEPCCDYPSVISETYTDAVDALRMDGADLVMAQIDFDSIEWYGFALLTDYCCDDVDCDGVEFEGDDEPLYKGVGGGGDNVDISCICDNLALINTTLANKFDGLNGKMDSLIETIEDKELTVELDDCICDNLESISDKLDSLDDIKDSIDNKVMPITDVSSVANAITNKQIPITDVSGITTAINNKQIPVTNVSGIESAITNKQIPVTDVSGLNTSLGNIDLTLGQIDGSIAGGTASIGSSIDDIDISLGSINTSLGGIDTSIDDVGSAIQNQSFTVDTSGLTCTDSQGNEEGLACILKNALNNRDGKSLSDVIDDKDVTSYVDVAVEPYDMVNIRRSFKDDDIQEG